MIFLIYCIHICFIPVINKPTRVSKTSATIIDHIWTNDMHNYSFSGILYTSVSDHFPLSSSFTRSNLKSNCSVSKFSKRVFTDENIDSGVNESFDIYLNHFLFLYNKHFPKKRIHS